MMTASAATVHGSAVLAGRCAILIRGASGSGKSRLALALLDAARSGLLGFARLVADDRVQLEASHGRVLARPPSALAGLLELRGVGITHVAFEPVAVVGLVVDLDAFDAQRMPAAAERTTAVAGIALPRLPVAAGQDALPAVLAALRSESFFAGHYRDAIPTKNR
jgi:serine kinase of HPr protein (carbohydrate metabolism regulator)